MRRKRCIMGHTRFLCIFLLAFSLASVSGHPEDTLEEINDLVGKDFGRSSPRHGLNLLYWFCREYITFDNNGNMQPATDPEQGAFGFHKYRNREDLLPSLNNQLGYDYYVVGNLNEERLPDYVLVMFRQSRNLDSEDQNNRDRIIVRRTRNGAIDRVYITQHYHYSSGRGSRYDPNNTYAVGTELIRAVRNLTRETFLKPFAPRTRGHYALCHPERGSGPPNRAVRNLPSERSLQRLSRTTVRQAVCGKSSRRARPRVNKPDL